MMADDVQQQAPVEQRRARVVALRKQGLSRYAIGVELGVSETTVRRDEDEARAAGEIDAVDYPEYVER